MGHDPGMFDQALDAPQALGQREDLATLQEAFGIVEIALEHGGHHPAESVHLALGKLVLGVARQSGIDHLLDLGMGG